MAIHLCRSLFDGCVSLLAIGVSLAIGVVTVTVKLAFFIPLLIRWNSHPWEFPEADATIENGSTEEPSETERRSSLAMQIAKADLSITSEDTMMASDCLTYILRHWTFVYSKDFNLLGCHILEVDVQRLIVEKGT